MAQCAQITATIAEEGPDQFRQRKHVLPMWPRGEQVTFQLLAVGERARDEDVLSLSQNLAHYTHLHGDPRWNALLEKLGKLPEDMRSLTNSVRLPD